ncbi:MAG: hypothetical protein N3G20_02400, partial [Verrucomicrobiae bacterium]|nr:hypothetical protein [Verrucomicrobiae bacterium]
MKQEDTANFDPLERIFGVLSSKQLVKLVIEGRDAPRVPVGPLAVHYCARVAGVSIRHYTSSAKKLAECVIRYAERFRPDAVWVSAVSYTH